MLVLLILWIVLSHVAITTLLVRPLLLAVLLPLVLLVSFIFGVHTWNTPFGFILARLHAVTRLPCVGRRVIKMTALSDDVPTNQNRSAISVGLRDSIPAGVTRMSRKAKLVPYVLFASC